jgi:hypothetical protein
MRRKSCVGPDSWRRKSEGISAWVTSPLSHQALPEPCQPGRVEAGIRVALVSRRDGEPE